jgi:hypothetical protein
MIRRHSSGTVTRESEIAELKSTFSCGEFRKRWDAGPARIPPQSYLVAPIMPERQTAQLHQQPQPVGIVEPFNGLAVRIKAPNLADIKRIR